MMKSFFFLLATTIGAFTLSSSLSGQTVPRPAPEFKYNLATTEGSSSLGKYKGKVVVLEFILTTCPHCQETSKHLQKIQNDWASKGLQVVAVAIDDQNGSKVGKFQKDFGVSFPVGYAQNRESMYGFLQRSMMDSRVMMPQIAIVDRNGTIQRQIPGEDPLLAGKVEENLRREISKVLDGGKPAVKSAAPAAAAKTSPTRVSSKK